MNEYLEKCIETCNQILSLLEDDYQELYKSLKGDIYDEYKLIIADEIERVEKIKQELLLFK